MQFEKRWILWATATKMLWPAALSYLDTFFCKMLFPVCALTNQPMILRETSCSDNVEFVWTSAVFGAGRIPLFQIQ